MTPTYKLLNIPFLFPVILSIWMLFLTTLCLIKATFVFPIFFSDKLFLAHQLVGLTGGLLLLYISFLLYVIQHKNK